MRVPAEHAAVIFRLGKYLRTQGAGPVMLLPLVDRVVGTVDLREQIIAITEQTFHTADERTVRIDASIRVRVVDPKAATLEIADYRQAVEQLTITALRNFTGEQTVEQARAGFRATASRLRDVLDQASSRWGLTIVGVEIVTIEPVRDDGRRFTTGGKS